MLPLKIKIILVKIKTLIDFAKQTAIIIKPNSKINRPDEQLDDVVVVY